jgi:hypothetical protein
MKICHVTAELFHVGGQTEMMKLTVALCGFVGAPKNHCFKTNK